MSEKKLTLEDAEAELKRLEKPGHDVDLAIMALRRAEQSGETSQISQALDVYRAAITAKEAANINQGDLDAVAQLVLELRGESHSEENVLPSDHGVATVLAGRELALAQGELTLSPRSAAAQRKVAEAQKNFDACEASDAADKQAHVAEAHRRTLAAQSKGDN